MKQRPCQGCGEITEMRSSVQKYCQPCSSEVDLARKRDWAREHPQVRNPVIQSARKDKKRELGVVASRRNRASITYMSDEYDGDEIHHQIRIIVPYDKGFSKNAIWSMGAKQGHVYIRKDIRSLKDSLLILLKQACKDHEWFEGKVWIDIFVEKPDARSDAINVLDTICDAIKEAIKIDDRWFGVRRIDWSIVKDHPRIFIGVGQSVSEHHRACSTCGTIKPLSTGFGSNTSGRLSKARECLECGSAIRQAKRNAEAPRTEITVGLLGDQPS